MDINNAININPSTYNKTFKFSCFLCQVKVVGKFGIIRHLKSKHWNSFQNSAKSFEKQLNYQIEINYPYVLPIKVHEFK